MEQTSTCTNAQTTQKINIWLTNHVGSSDNRLPKSLRTEWTGREVYYTQEAETIQEDVEKLMEVDGTIRHLTALNKARTRGWADLGPDKQDEYNERAEIWTTQGPDASLHAK